MTESVANSFVRSVPIPPRAAPRDGQTILAWVQEKFFSSFWNAALTLTGLFILYLVVTPLIKFFIVNAVWSGEDRSACLAADAGACWAYVKAKFGQFIYGRYPLDERWRVDIVFYTGALALIPMLIPSIPGKWPNVIFLLVIYPVMSFILLTGGMFGLEAVPTTRWGGLLVTLVVAVTGIAASFPLGILLALGRRSDRPIIKYLSIGFIEFWRGVPLITILFMSSVLLPLFLPEGVDIDKLLRALIGVTLYAAAYNAEVVRGGLQAIPRGQYEAAKALGLGYWRMMGFIILPQALKHVIPGLVNNFIALFKDSTLVLIIGLFDLLGIVQQSFTDTKWATPVTSLTGYAFAAIIFWAFCFAMSRYSLFIEKRLSEGRER